MFHLYKLLFENNTAAKDRHEKKNVSRNNDSTPMPFCFVFLLCYYYICRHCLSVLSKNLYVCSASCYIRRSTRWTVSHSRSIQSMATTVSQAQSNHFWIGRHLADDDMNRIATNWTEWPHYIIVTICRWRDVILCWCTITLRNIPIVVTIKPDFCFRQKALSS